MTCYYAKIKGVYEVKNSEKKEKKFLEQIMEKWNLSVRAYEKICKVARTIADMEESEKITLEHIGEAAGYRLEKGK